MFLNPVLVLQSKVFRSFLIFGLIPLTVLLAVPADAADSVPLLKGGVNWHVVLDGVVVNRQIGCPADELGKNGVSDPCTIHLLIRPNDGWVKGEPEEEIPLTLAKVVLQVEGEARVDKIKTGLDPELRLGLLDYQSRGVPDPILVRRGEVLVVEDGKLRTLMREPRAPRDGLLDSLGPHSEIQAWNTVGRVALWRVAEGEAQRLGHVRVPVQAEAGSATLRLTSPRLFRFDGGTRDVFALEPKIIGPTRWSTSLIERAGPDEETHEDSGGWKVTETFLQPPGVEKPAGDPRFFEIDSRSFVLVQALRADKLGILEKKKVRIFPLRESRTRAGTKAVFEHLTVSRIWQDLGVNWDSLRPGGGEDLLLFQREGFSGKKLQVDRFEATGLARFGRSGRNLIKTPYADYSLVPDLNGDGLKDLVLVSEEILLLPGTPKGQKAFGKAPLWRFPLPESASREPLRTEVTIGSDSETQGEMSNSAEVQLDEMSVGEQRWGEPSTYPLFGQGKVEVLVPGTERIRKPKDGEEADGPLSRSTLFVLSLDEV